MDIYSGLNFGDFVLSVLTGLVLGALWDVFRLFRVFFSLSKTITAVLDILFMAIASGITFLLCLATTYGYLRFVLFFGEALGFALYTLTLGFFTLWLIKLLKKVLSALYRKTVLPFLNRIRKAVDSITKRKFEKKKKKLIKIRKRFKKTS